MRSMLFVVVSFALTVLCWGLYGPVLHEGQHLMSTDGGFARWRPFVCVGLAYFLIGVLAPMAWLIMRGEKGAWTMTGIVQSLFAGALGAVGALGIILAFTFGGKPFVVMPLVFGGAPVVNSFLTIVMAKKLKEVGPLFLAGLAMVLLGAVTVLLSAPKAAAKPAPEPAPVAVAADDAATGGAGEGETAQAPPAKSDGALSAATRFGLQLASIATVIVCWGAYGPVLHRGQAGMQGSRLRPLVCVGLAYFAIAVVVPQMILTATPEASTYNFFGTAWSLAAGAAGALGALGIILAFNFGGKPVFVMPLVFGGAPIVNTLAEGLAKGAFAGASSLGMSVYMAGLMLAIAGAAMVLVFAPKGAPPKKPADKSAETKVPATAPA
ncbi:hypothetical protein Pla175_12000 [Pirellulimonas nuda]|uniref:EamA-like transporter family protein n=1 Tax=Pirellulimonas nuda TaxID=2528009 RepID=A0A518D8N8_9BACT|nr:hypothetical protein [Pirellulimonas nuda]QDU87833.1 hypothetical protein Pla175_12000 [Pirellulimonas nuda]